MEERERIKLLSLFPRKDLTFAQTWRKREIALMGVPYRDYLRSERWKKVKEKLREQGHGRYCTICKGTRNLAFHHRTYRYINSCDETLGITTLCRKCHTAVHKLAKIEGCSVATATKIYKRKLKK